MPNFPALDVAIGLIFVFFILAIVCSGINEAISSLLRWRAQMLERGLWELLHDPDAGEKASEALDALKKHPLLKPMLYPKNKQAGQSSQVSPKLDKNGRPKTSRKTDLPSYLASRTFSSALLGIDQAMVRVPEGKDLKEGMRRIEDSIAAIPSKPVQEALTALLHNAQGESVAFRRNVEQWFDDQMERVSGWYRRRIQIVLWVLAFAVAFALNADTLQIAKRLWVEPSARAALVNQAQAGSSTPDRQTDAAKELEDLAVPLGWHLESARDDPQGFPIYKDWEMIWALVSKLIGLTLTAVAISFGAPFWFDTLSKIARLRNGGAPPPASDAVRRGEGEEARAGEQAALTTALLAARGTNVESEPAPEPSHSAPTGGPGPAVGAKAATDPAPKPRRPRKSKPPTAGGTPEPPPAPPAGDGE
jgi:hypothetical protein